MTTPPAQPDPLAVAVGLAYAATRTAEQLDRLATTLDRIARDMAFIRALLEDRRP